MRPIQKISRGIQGVGLLGCLIFVWRIIDWHFIKGAPTAMGNLEVLGPVLGILASAGLLLLGLLLLGADWLYHHFRASP